MSVLGRLGRLHDLLTQGGAILSALCLGAIAVLYCGEVVARYLLGAPSSWTAAVSIYLMLGTTMLMLPALTMTNDHVAVSLSESLPGAAARWTSVAILLISAVVCIFGAYFSYEEMARSFMRGVRTTDTLFIPKWWLLALVVYGLASTAVHFVRQFLGVLLSNRQPERKRV